MRDAHEKQLHAGTNSTITFIRQKYWVPAIRQVVRSVLRKCVTCKKVVGRPYAIPDPPPLPSHRVDQSEPFKVTGVDFTGALRVKDVKKEHKAYICLFTCASTRAVHLELLHDLSEESFMNCFRRFCSRKSTPSIMISDNGSTFQAASVSIKQLVRASKLQDSLHLKGIQWQFIPSRAPWFGGWWERLIGLTKMTLKKVLGHSLVSFEELQTLVTEVEAILNDRPITYVPTESNDPEALTPSELLYGRRITSLPHYNDTQTPSSVSFSRTSATRRAKRLGELLNHFHDRWTHEYLTALRERHQTSGNNSQRIRVGDIVQIHQESPRVQWKLARVDELFPGSDGLVRSAKLRTANGFLNRPIKKLYPLEV